MTISKISQSFDDDGFLRPAAFFPAYFAVTPEGLLSLLVISLLFFLIAIYTTAYLKAAETVWGVRPAFKREGGSVPVVGDFQKILGVDVVNMGFGLPTDNMHGPNEKLELPNWYRGIDALIHYFFNLAE